MNMKREINYYVLSFIVVIVLGLTQISNAAEVQTTGKGPKGYTSASGTLPNAVSFGTTYNSSLTITASSSTPNSQFSSWLINVKAILKGKNWAGKSTVGEAKGEIGIGGNQTTLQTSYYLKKIPSYLMKKGSLWWEVTVTVYNPFDQRLFSEKYKTSVVNFTIVK